VHSTGSTLFTELLILFGLATLLLTLFYRLRLTSLLAFILTGAICGPTGLGLVSDSSDLADVASLGLSFLLFLLGLEFSFARLIALRHTVFRLGLAQVALCTLAFMAAFAWWGLPFATSLLLSAGLALSSTAIVSRELQRLGLLTTRHGEIAIGVLLFQDLVAVILLIAVPLLSSQESRPDIIELAISLVSTIGLLVAFFLSAQYLLPRILREVSRHKSDELLVLTALVIVLLCATLTSMIGLSMELGAFLAGMMLSESSFRHQLEADIRPFRDLLLGLFFITVGMLIDLQLLATYWFRIILAGLAFVTFKGVIIALVAKALGESWRAAVPAGMALAQGGEFLFALLALSVQAMLVPPDEAAFLISMTIVSMIMAPLIIHHGPSLVNSAWLRIGHAGLSDHTSVNELPELYKENHVVILGFGRVGQSVARFFRQLDIEYVVLESDAVRVAECAVGGEPVYYAITTRRDVLKAAGVDKARLIVISFDQTGDTRLILQQIRELNPAIPVLIRTRDDSHLNELMELGATEVIPETHEASLTLASHALLMLGIAPDKVDAIVGAARRGRYRMLQGFYHGERMNLTLRKNPEGRALHAVVLTGAAWACNKVAGALQLPDGLQLQEVHRRDLVVRESEMQNFILRHGDVLVLHGKLDDMPQGEGYLLRGKA